MSTARLCLLCGLLLIPELLYAGTANAPGVRVTKSGPEHREIKLEARQAPLKQVLDAIGRETGTRLHYTALPEAPVTANCTGTAVKQILGCLLGPEADLMFRYPDRSIAADGQRQPSDIWVLASSFSGGSVSSATQISDNAAANVPSSAEQRGQEAPAANESRGSASATTQKLLKMAQSRNPAERENALSRLLIDDQIDGITLRRTLETALADGNADVRAQAVYGITRQGGPDTLAILQTALHDPDASVRLMAVDSVGSDPQSLALLREALADSDETVRAYAALKLEPPNHQDSLE